jgi:hypothetical protein
MTWDCSTKGGRSASCGTTPLGAHGCSAGVLVGVTDRRTPEVTTMSKYTDNALNDLLVQIRQAVEELALLIKEERERRSKADRV